MFWKHLRIPLVELKPMDWLQFNWHEKRHGAAEFAPHGSPRKPPSQPMLVGGRASCWPKSRCLQRGQRMGELCSTLRYQEHPARNSEESTASNTPLTRSREPVPAISELSDGSSPGRKAPGACPCRGDAVCVKLWFSCFPF